MEDQALFSVMAQCFGPVSEQEWSQLTAADEWQDFLGAARSALQDSRLLGAEAAPARQLRGFCPLQEFLSVGEVDALFRPPTFAEKESFAARHFTGGLPASALPVESLYEVRAGRATGAYWGDAARSVSALVESLGLEVPHAFSACPDHLALELDLMAVLLRSGCAAQARAFFAERFSWLTAYRMRLLELGSQASFYVGLVDVLLGMREQQLMVMQSTFAPYETCIR